VTPLSSFRGSRGSITTLKSVGDITRSTQTVCRDASNWMTLARCGPQLLLLNTLPAASFTLLRAPTLHLTSTKRTPLELDGEFVGELPATFGVQKLGLRVVVPKAFSALGSTSEPRKTSCNAAGL